MACLPAEIREPDDDLAPEQQIMWDESKRFDPLGIDVAVVRIATNKKNGSFCHDAVYWRKKGNSQYSFVNATPAFLNVLLNKIGDVVADEQRKKTFANFVAMLLGYGSYVDDQWVARIIESEGYLPDRELLKSLSHLPGDKNSLSFACRGPDEFTYWRVDLKFTTPTRLSGLTISEIVDPPSKQKSEQNGTDHPASRSESRLERNKKPQPESKVTPR